MSNTTNIISMIEEKARAHGIEIAIGVLKESDLKREKIIFPCPKEGSKPRLQDCTYAKFGDFHVIYMHQNDCVITHDCSYQGSLIFPDAE